MYEWMSAISKFISKLSKWMKRVVNEGANFGWSQIYLNWSLFNISEWIKSFFILKY